MANLYCITRELWRSSSTLSDFKIYKGKLSREDIATLIETFEFAIDEVPIEYISDVLRNSENLFAFLVDKNSNGVFDFYKYLNDYFEGSASINPVNAKMMFPRSLSRGIYSEYEGEEVSKSPSIDYDDEEATGYMDSEPEEDNIEVVLRYDATGAKVRVSGDKEVVLGRSQKTADFVIEGNSNISRNHAKVYIKNGKAYIQDMKSANCTFVNNSKVEPGEDKVISTGDVIMLADEKFTVNIV